MNGSEKQVKWAEAIIKEAKNRMDTRLENAEGRKDGMKASGNYSEIEQVFYSVIAATAPAIKAELDKFDDAGHIINNQGTIRREAFVNVIKSGVCRAEIDTFLKSGQMSKQQVFDFILG